MVNTSPVETVELCPRKGLVNKMMFLLCLWQENLS